MTDTEQTEQGGDWMDELAKSFAPLVAQAAFAEPVRKLSIVLPMTPELLADSEVDREGEALMVRLLSGTATPRRRPKPKRARPRTRSSVAPHTPLPSPSGAVARPVRGQPGRARRAGHAQARGPLRDQLRRVGERRVLDGLAVRHVRGHPGRGGLTWTPTTGLRWSSRRCLLSESCGSSL